MERESKIKKVLIALDDNPMAQKVAEMGHAVAKSMKAEVTLLHVMPYPVYYPSAEYCSLMGLGFYTEKEPVLLDNPDEKKETFQQFLDNAKESLEDDTIQTLVKEGGFSEAILEAAAELRADLIVLGSHSQRWLGEVLMGTVTEKVINHSSVPLLIIPTKHKK